VEVHRHADTKTLELRLALRYRALNPLSDEDAGMLEAIERGAHRIGGVRNRDLRPILHGERPTDAVVYRPISPCRSSAGVVASPWPDQESAQDPSPSGHGVRSDEDRRNPSGQKGNG